MADTQYFTSCDLSQGGVAMCSAVVWSCCAQVKLKNLHAIRRLKGRLTALKAMAQGVSVDGRTWAIQGEVQLIAGCRGHSCHCMRSGGSRGA